jgi:hypothetical protein
MEPVKLIRRPVVVSSPALSLPLPHGGFGVLVKFSDLRWPTPSGACALSPLHLDGISCLAGKR